MKSTTFTTPFLNTNSFISNFQEFKPLSKNESKIKKALQLIHNLTIDYKIIIINNAKNVSINNNS